MPDPLIGSHGQPLVSREGWQARRAEIRELILHYSVGSMPPGEAVEAFAGPRAEVPSSSVSFQLVRLAIGRGVEFEVAVFRPRDAEEPIPTLVHPSFFVTPGVEELPPDAERSLGYGRLGSPDPGAAVERLSAILEHGFAIVTWNYQATASDRSDNRSSGLLAAYREHDWGAIGAWAWTMQRVADWLATEPWAGPLIATGFSRLGKTALLAAALDERFALCAPIASGCNGTGAFRFNGPARTGKEGLEEYTSVFPYQVGPRLPLFAGSVERLPYDQHWLMALVAPRPLISIEAIEDECANGYAMKQSWYATKPVYDLLGGSECLGVSFREGRHDLTDEDWTAVLDFADWQLLGNAVIRRFDQFPPDERLLA